MSSISDGKEKAKSCDAKYVETSCVLKHNVDELLVGVTKQVLLRKEESSMGGNSRNGNQSRVNLFFVIYGVDDNFRIGRMAAIHL